MNHTASVVAWRFSALGDVAMTVPVLQCVARQNNVQIKMISRPFFKPVFKGLESVEFTGKDVDKTYHSPAQLWKLSRELHQLHPDTFLDLHDVLRTKILRFYLKLQGDKVFVIDKGRKEKRKLIKQGALHAQPLKTTHERYADVFRKAGFQVDLSLFEPITLQVSEEVELFLDIFKGQTLLGVAPLARHVGKQYPLGGTREIIQQIINKRNDVSILLFGAPSEKKLLDYLVTNPNRIFNLAGMFNFEKELEIISRLDMMWSMDSGNGHLAANYGIPVFTTWGITHPYTGFAPFGQTRAYQLTPDLKKYPKLPCSIYGNKICKGYENIWDDMTPEIVAGRILKLL